MAFEQLLDIAEHAFELAGVLILLVGGAISLGVYIRSVASGHRRVAYDGLRQNVGRTILLGLEVLIVADIILRVAIDADARERAHTRPPGGCAAPGMGGPELDGDG